VLKISHVFLFHLKRLPWRGVINLTQSRHSWSRRSMTMDQQKKANILTYSCWPAKGVAVIASP